MAKVEVIATRTGYYAHKRRKEGEVFFIDDSLIKKGKDGKITHPTWVQLKSNKTVSKEIADKAKLDPALSPDDEVI